MPAHNLIHGGDVYTAMENGLERPLDFSANIGPLGLPPAVAEAARRAVGSCDTYPDPLCRRLTAALAEAEGVPADWIACGDGAVSVLSIQPAGKRRMSAKEFSAGRPIPAGTILK